MADFRKVQNTPKWTASGTLNYDTPLASGRLNLNTTLSYRSKSQQFEIASPGIDQDGYSHCSMPASSRRSPAIAGRSACTART